jgi:hypothetical protein
MAYSKSFFALTAICSLVSVVTTLVLTFAGDFIPEAQSLEDRIAHLSNPIHQMRMWTYYIHPFVTFIAALGVYVIAKRFDAGFALLAIVFIGVWAFAEALQQALTIVALNWTWRGTYLAADAATQELYRSHMDMYAALWDGLYFLLLSGFILGSFFFAVALLPQRGFDRLIGALFLVVSALSVLNFMAGYQGPAWAGAIANFAYPVIQPVTRALIGVWIWRSGAKICAQASPTLA